MPTHSAIEGVHFSTAQAMNLNESSSSMQIDVDLSSSSKEETGARTQESRGVRFNEQVQIALIPAKTDFTSEEIKAAWINEEDMIGVMAEAELTQYLMKTESQKHHVDDELFCSRGVSDLESLEARTESNSFIQKLVLGLFAQGVVDIDTIAGIYHDCAAPPLEKAQEAARRDAEDAKSYLEDMIEAQQEESNEQVPTKTVKDSHIISPRSVSTKRKRLNLQLAMPKSIFSL
jgi:hypothetical protein